MQQFLFIIFLFVLTTLLGLAIFKWLFRRSLIIEQRLEKYFSTKESQHQSDARIKRKNLSKVILHLQIFLKKRMRESSIIELEKRLDEAGRPYELTAIDFRLIQLTISTLLFFMAFLLFFPLVESIWSLCYFSGTLGLLGVYIPTFLLSSTTKKRVRKMERMMPDFFDLLNLSMEAGMGLDASFQKVSNTLKGPLSEEFLKMLDDLKLGKSRKEAYTLLRERVKVMTFQQAVTSLIQADQLGMGLSKTVQLLTTRIREQRVFNAREHAMKAPVKMVFPLMFLVFPAIFIVLLGPMVIYILQSGL